MTPSARSVEYLQAEGWTVDIVERRIPHRPITKDCFGCFDLIAVRPGEAALIQVTTDSNVSARIRKIAESEVVPKVRESGKFTLWVHGWKQKGGKWTLRVVDVT